MKFLVTVSTLIFSVSAIAGITGPVKTEMVSCNGPELSVGAQFTVGGGSKSAEQVANPYEHIVKIYSKDIIRQLENNYVVAPTTWDKTLWYKGIGVDINDVSDHVSMLVRNGSVDFVSGGSTEYQNTRALVNDKNLDKLPKTSIGQMEKHYHNIKLIPNGYGEFELRVSLITAGVQKCVKSKVIKNPYFIDGDEAHGVKEFITVCDQFEEVKPLSMVTEYSRTVSVDATCDVGDLPL